MLRRLVHWLQPTFLLLAIVAIGWFLASQWPTLRTYPWRLHWGWLLATCAFSLASWAVEIAIWRHLLATLGGKLPYLVAVRLWFLSAVVRYVPGNVWQPLSLTLYSRRHGVSPEATITSLVLFQVVMLLAIAPILVLYFVWLDTKSLAAQFVANFPPALLWLALIPVLAFLLRPQWLVQLLNWGLARMKRPPLALQLTSGKLFLLIAVSLFDWLLWGGLFASFTFAVIGDGLASGGSDEFALAPLLVASYPIANFIGFLALITPSGFGVREGAFYLLLTPHIAGSVVTVIALGARVWGVASELLAALISAPFERASLARLDRARETNQSLPLDLPPYYEPGPEPLPEAFVAPDLASDLVRAGRRKSL